MTVQTQEENESQKGRSLVAIDKRVIGADRNGVAGRKIGQIADTVIGVPVARRLQGGLQQSDIPVALRATVQRQTSRVENKQRFLLQP